MLITDKTALKKFYSPNRLWQGIPGIEVTAKGRLFCAFYSGGRCEEYGNYCVLVSSDDDGLSWSEPIAAIYHGENARCYDPCLWMDPLGRLWFFWAVSPDHAAWATVCDKPDAQNLQWSDPFLIAPEVMMNKPIVLRNGDYLLPISVWDAEIRKIKNASPTERRPFVYRSRDKGKTFEKLGGPLVEDRSFDEHMVVERKDGSLLMLTRTEYGIGKSLSFDGGLTWSDAVGSGLKGPSSRFHLRRLNKREILLINHHNFNGRNNLTAMISDDECETWKGFLTIDERDNVSYPDSAQTQDGTIYIVYDRERGANARSLQEVLKDPREILLAKVSVEDILAGKLVSPGSCLKSVVSKLGDYKGTLKDPYKRIE